MVKASKPIGNRENFNIAVVLFWGGTSAVATQNG